MIILFGVLKLLEKVAARPIPPDTGRTAWRKRDMRRGSVIGPLILIGIGGLFLLRNLWPEIPLVDIIAKNWPFVLIAWGGLRLIEILMWSMMGKPIPAQRDFRRRMDAGFSDLRGGRLHVHCASLCRLVSYRPGVP